MLNDCKTAAGVPYLASWIYKRPVTKWPEHVIIQTTTGNELSVQRMQHGN